MERLIERTKDNNEKGKEHIMTESQRREAEDALQYAYEDYAMARYITSHYEGNRTGDVYKQAKAKEREARQHWLAARDRVSSPQ